MRGGLQVPARLLPLARLLEVVIHHVDLDIGYEITDIDGPTAEWLLEWCAFRLRDRDEFPKLELVSDSGFTIAVGSAGEPITIRGTSANLLGWLMNRTDRSAVQGDEGLQLPGLLSPTNVGGHIDSSGGAMPGFNHVTPRGAPLLLRLSGSVTMTKVSVGPMDNNAYLLQADGATVLIDAANDDQRLLKIISDGGWTPS